MLKNLDLSVLNGNVSDMKARLIALLLLTILSPIFAISQDTKPKLPVLGEPKAAFESYYGEGKPDKDGYIVFAKGDTLARVNFGDGNAANYIDYTKNHEKGFANEEISAVLQANSPKGETWKEHPQNRDGFVEEGGIPVALNTFKIRSDGLLESAIYRGEDKKAHFVIRVRKP
jgi:hypothetical protein